MLCHNEQDIKILLLRADPGLKSSFRTKKVKDRQMANSSTLPLVLIFLVASSLATLSVSLEDVGCVYSVFIRTGSEDGSGTNSNISVTLYDGKGKAVNFSNIVQWGGAMEPGHDYFEEDNLDIFSGRARCLDVQPCKMEIMSDGTGVHPHWYCLYVKVVMIHFSGGSIRQDFIVERRLQPPSDLKAVVNFCSQGTPVAGNLGLRKVSSSTVS